MEAQGLWSAEQHQWLGAMGLAVYAHADSIQWPPQPLAPRFENLPERQDPAPVVPAARNAVPVERVAPPPMEVAVAAEARSAPEPLSLRPGSRRGSARLAGLPDKLMLALLRASAQNPNEPATQALMASWPLAELRANPAAKRALWPQLRALRRQRNGR